MWIRSISTEERINTNMIIGYRVCLMDEDGPYELEAKDINNHPHSIFIGDMDMCLKIAQRLDSMLSVKTLGSGLAPREESLGGRSATGFHIPTKLPDDAGDPV